MCDMCHRYAQNGTCLDKNPSSQDEKVKGSCARSPRRRPEGARRRDSRNLLERNRHCLVPYNSLLPTPALLALLLVDATLTFLTPPLSSSAPDDEEAAAAALLVEAAVTSESELNMAGAESP